MHASPLFAALVHQRADTLLDCFFALSFGLALAYIFYALQAALLGQLAVLFNTSCLPQSLATKSRAGSLTDLSAFDLTLDVPCSTPTRQRGCSPARVPRARSPPTKSSGQDTSDTLFVVSSSEGLRTPLKDVSNSPAEPSRVTQAALSSQADSTFTNCQSDPSVSMGAPAKFSYDHVRVARNMQELARATSVPSMAGLWRSLEQVALTGATSSAQVPSNYVPRSEVDNVPRAALVSDSVSAKPSLSGTSAQRRPDIVRVASFDVGNVSVLASHDTHFELALDVPEASTSVLPSLTRETTISRTVDPAVGSDSASSSSMDDVDAANGAASHSDPHILALPVDDEGFLVLQDITDEIAAFFGLPAPPKKRKVNRGGRRRTAQIRRQSEQDMVDYREVLLASGAPLPPMQRPLLPEPFRYPQPSKFPLPAPEENVFSAPRAIQKLVAPHPPPAQAHFIQQQSPLPPLPSSLLLPQPAPRTSVRDDYIQHWRLHVRDDSTGTDGPPATAGDTAGIIRVRPALRGAWSADALRSMRGWSTPTRQPRGPGDAPFATRRAPPAAGAAPWVPPSRLNGWRGPGPQGIAAGFVQPQQLGRA